MTKSKSRVANIKASGIDRHHGDIALVPQGGDALGAYQCSAYEELASTGSALRDLLSRLPEQLKNDADVQHLVEATRVAPTDIVQLIYQQVSYELESKDYEFSRVSVLEHGPAGRHDMCDTIKHPECLKATGLDDGVTQYDLTRHSRPI